MPSSVATAELTDFLKQPEIEASPAWEFISGRPYQKPMPTLFYSRLQRNLVNAINRQTEAYEAIQELRCIVPPFSPVPDIAVVAIERLPEADGPFTGAPDWLIEIRSPEQSTLKLQKKILHCIDSGTRLAWLIDIQLQQVWVWEGQELPLIYSESAQVPVIDNLLALAVTDIMEMTTSRK